MKHKEVPAPHENRRQVPSHDPMPGVDDKPIDAGATTGAQLPPRKDTRTGRTVDRQDDKSRLNPNQGDLLTPFWSKK